MDIKKIVFYGTPQFAVKTLKVLNDRFTIAAVVTAMDKPAGRGLKITESAVKSFAKAHNLLVLQPKNLGDIGFIQEIERLKPDVQIVVAFKKLPPELFRLGRYGTINLHASLLPDYRGAAPINHAIINGEKETGLTTFYINEKIDHGHIILQEKIPIEDYYTAGDLHDIMMFKGPDVLLRTLDAICRSDFKPVSQSSLHKNKQLKKAPKIFKKDCRINWHSKGLDIYNFIRGLSPHPCAFTTLISPENNTYDIKIFEALFEEKKHNLSIGKLLKSEGDGLKVVVESGFITLRTVQLMGKSKMPISAFLRGFRLDGTWQLKPY